MRALGYARATLGEQADEASALLDQRHSIETHAAERGWELVEIYEDAPSRTERPADRPGLSRLLQNLNGIDRVIITRLDRMRPSSRSTYQLLKRFQDAGVQLVSLEEGFDTGDASGHAIAPVLSLTSDWEMHVESLEGWKPERIRKPGLAPATVIDVGAGAGTPTLYQAFPDAYHVLIEPLKEFEQDLRRVVAAYRGEHVMSAVGAERGTTTIHVEHEGLMLSSILERSSSGNSKVEAREIPITTLDELRRRLDWQPPFGLKIDTEGYEHNVIGGATELLKETEFVIAEISTRPKRFDQNYSFAEFIALMDEHGFRFCDILDAPRLQRAVELQYIDGMFRRIDAAVPID
jgi:FkbM family methyltransferase